MDLHNKLILYSCLVLVLVFVLVVFNGPIKCKEENNAFSTECFAEHTKSDDHNTLFCTHDADICHSLEQFCLFLTGIDQTLLDWYIPQSMPHRKL